jgi:hypothetical protein
VVAGDCPTELRELHTAANSGKVCSPQQLVAGAMPHACCVVIATGDDDRAVQAGHNRIQPPGVPLQHSNTLPCPCVPHTRCAVLGGRHQHVAGTNELHAKHTGQAPAAQCQIQLRQPAWLRGPPSGQQTSVLVSWSGLNLERIEPACNFAWVNHQDYHSSANPQQRSHGLSIPSYQTAQLHAGCSGSCLPTLTLTTQPVCPLHVLRHSLCSRSHTFTLKSSLQLTPNTPSCDRATSSTAPAGTTVGSS